MELDLIMKAYKHFIPILFLVFTMSSCIDNRDNCYYKIDINANIKSIYKSNHYNYNEDIYDIKINNKYYLFLYNKGNNIIFTTRNNLNIKNKYNITQSKNPNKISFFTKEVNLDKYADTIYLTKGEQDLFKLWINEKHIYIDSMQSFLLSNSQNCNITKNKLFAFNMQKSRNSPCYIYSNSEYFWIKPDPILREKNIYPLLYINHLCVNEKTNTIAIAYRFTNHISFYDFEGNLKRTIKIGADMTPRQIDLDDLNIIKYFIGIYGTEKHLYCLYSGSTDLSTSSKIFKFNWNGKFIESFLLDRPIETFAIDEKNRSIITISSSNSEGKDIVIYDFNK